MSVENSDLRFFDLVASNVPDEAKPDVSAIGDRLREALSEEHALRSSGHYTGVGLATLPRPRRENAQKALVNFEGATSRERKVLDDAYEAVASGRRVKNQKGQFEDVTFPEPTAVMETRHGEIRAMLRAMDESDRRDAIRKAFAEGHDEVFLAASRAPKGFELIDAATNELIRQERLTRSGWMPAYERQRMVLDARDHAASKARQVLGLDAIR